MKLEFSRQIFEKYSDVKFLENSFSANRAVPCGASGRAARQTDRQTGHEEANSRLPQVRERV
jgi:hypothetical protein